MKSYVEEDVYVSPDVEMNKEKNLAEDFGNDLMYADPKTPVLHNKKLK